jgi:hypothetical protein
MAGKFCGKNLRATAAYLGERELLLRPVLKRLLQREPNAELIIYV